MKKIDYKLVAALAIAMLAGFTSNLALAQDAAVDPAHPDAKTHEKDATKKTTTVTQSKKTEDKPAEHRPVADTAKPEVHHDTAHADTHYTHDNQGWYDGDHHRHDFITYRGERGYWDYANGQAVFISIGSSAVIQIHI